MAYVTPSTTTVGELITAAKLNQELRDNVAYLKGVLDGTQTQAVVLTSTISVTGGAVLNGGAAVGNITSGGGQIDFHSVSGHATYDARLVVSGGSSGTPGVGTLSLQATGGLILDGPLKAPNGAVTTPSITFASDLNCGLYRFGADDISYVVGGVEVVRMRTVAAAPQISFYGLSPQARGTVTGSRGANAALASLLTLLQSLGLIIDSSS